MRIVQMECNKGTGKLLLPEVMDEEVLKRFAGVLGDRAWRLDHFYWVESKMVQDGNKVVRFRRNEVQVKLHNGMWHRNAILKSRQMGISTYLALLILDCLLFIAGFHAGVVDKTLPDALLKLEKIRFAWDRLDWVPPNATDEDLWLARLGRIIKERTGKWVKGRLVPVFANDRELTFANGSDVFVGASLRGGTLDLLWLTEFGSTACHHPGKAAEILSGAFNTVSKDGFLFNESTHEGGRSGLNYEIMKGALDLTGQRLSKVQWKFFFFPWFEDSGYTLSGEGYDVLDEDREYFEDLKEKGINLSQGQMVWYSHMKQTQKELMKQEYPSTPEEALWPHVTGAIYGAAMHRLRAQGRVGVAFAVEPGYPLVSAWDLGLNDSTAIWAAQIVGYEVRLLKFYQNSGLEMAEYAEVIRVWEREMGMSFDEHLFPHDGNRRNWGGDPMSLFRSTGIGGRLVRVPRIPRVWMGIDAVRTMLKNAVFHEDCLKDCRGEADVKLLSGVDCIAAYRKKTVLENGVSHDVPDHNEASHGADALRTLGEALKKGLVSKVKGFADNSGEWVDDEDAAWEIRRRRGGLARMD